MTATIYVGTKMSNGDILSTQAIKDVIQDEVDRIGWCVTVTETRYIYTGGSEPGVAVGIINYPRFPEARNQLTDKVKELAQVLLKACGQCRVSAVIGDETYMWSDTETIVLWEEHKGLREEGEEKAKQIMSIFGMGKKQP